MRKINLIKKVANDSNVGELRGILSEARRQGRKTAIIPIPVHLFAIDETYQVEERTNRSLSYLTKDFREEKLLPVTGVPHDEEGKMYLVDGYGRWQASQIVDKRDGTEKYKYLDCLVILNAPTEPKERQKFEAEHYAFQNLGTARVTPLQRHGAYTCMNYPAAVILNEMKEKYGFKLTKGRGQRTAGYLGSYSTAFRICEVNGRDCADYIFNICKKSGFHLKANGYSTYVFMALRDIWLYYPEQREIAAKFLSKYLRKREPAQFKAEAMAEYGMLDNRIACSLYAEDLLVENVEFEHVRTVEDNKVKQIEKAS